MTDARPHALSAGARETARHMAARYDHDAAVYHELWAPILRAMSAPLARALAGGPVTHVLDVGTGVGALLPDLAAVFPGASVHGFDRSEGMLGLANDRFGRAAADAQQLPVRSASVDRVLFVFMLFHLEEPARALAEAHRVLRPGGRLGALTWAKELDSEANQVWLGCLDRHGAAPPDPGNALRYGRVDTPDKIAALLEAAGFGSARSWEEERETPLDLERFLRLKTGLGAARLRFDTLAPEAAAACVADARARLRTLGPGAFLSRARIVHAIAER